MARATRTIARQRNRAHLSPTLTLAFWRLRKTWGLLLVTGLGMVTAVILACTVPLYSQVAMSAGLRGVLNASAQNADMIVRGSSTRISSPIISTLTRQLNQEVEHHLGSYIASPQFSLEQIFSFPTTHERMGLVGTSMDQAASHLRLVAGRLPRATSDALEIAVTPQTASLLHLTYQATVGSVLKVNLDFLGADQTLAQRSFTVPLHLVGIFTLDRVDDPFWHGNNFEVSQVRDEPPLYPGLVANEAILAAMTHIGDQAAVDHLVLTTTSSLNWYYRFDTSRMAIDQLDDILNNIYTVKVDNANTTALDQSPFIDQAETYLPSDLLEQYRSRIAVAQIPLAGLLVLILGLVLFFVFLMIDLLVDRQSEAIALLRSRRG